MRALLFGAFLLLLTAGCKHEVEPYHTEPLSEYLPVALGSYNVYQLDSTLFTGPYRSEVVRHYQEKQLVAAQLTDNLGRPAFRVEHYLRDSAGTASWHLTGTSYIIPLEKTVEIMENNLRTQRLAAPVMRGFTWKGNEYLPFAPYGNLYDFRSDFNYNLKLWEFAYSAVGDTLSLNGQTYENVVTVQQIDEEATAADNAPIVGRTYSVDRYAKGIGLVYQERILEEETDPSAGDVYTIGFGVKRSLLEHR